MRRLVVAVCAGMALGACDAGGPPSDSRYEDAEFSSQTTSLVGFRIDDLRHGYQVYALGLDGPLCLSLTPADEDALFHPENDALTYFEAEGRISARGRFGHMGRCSRAFAVSRLVQDRAPTEAEREMFGRLGNNALRARPGRLSGPAQDPMAER